MRIAGSSRTLLANTNASEYNESMKSAKIDVSHIAKLANLPLSKEETEKFEKQLKETLDYVKRLEQIDTENVKETSQVTGLENVTREDVVAPSLPQEKVLKNAKSTYNGFFIVPAILESES